jgi:hypothetical protein
MPHIEVFPTRVTLSLSTGQDEVNERDTSRLSFIVRSAKPWHSEVLLVTGEKLSEMRGFVAFHSGPAPSNWPPVPKPTFLGEPSDEKIPVIGQLGYFAAVNDEFDSHPASYSAEVWLPTSQFEEVMGAARIGKMPRAVVLEVASKGFKYGSMPDGSEKNWDNKAHPRLGIIKASVHLVLGASDSDVDGEAEERGIPVRDPAPTGPQMAELLALVKGLPVKLFWVGAALVGALVFLLRR